MGCNQSTLVQQDGTEGYWGLVPYVPPHHTRAMSEPGGRSIRRHAVEGDDEIEYRRLALRELLGGATGEKDHRVVLDFLVSQRATDQTRKTARGVVMGVNQCVGCHPKFGPRGCSYPACRDSLVCVPACPMCPTRRFVPCRGTHGVKGDDGCNHPECRYQIRCVASCNQCPDNANLVNMLQRKFKVTLRVPLAHTKPDNWPTGLNPDHDEFELMFSFKRSEGDIESAIRIVRTLLPDMCRVASGREPRELSPVSVAYV